MNKLFKPFAFLILVGFFVSCQDDSSPNQEEIKRIQEEMNSGLWKITSFIDSGEDETSHFSGYIFEFTPAGVINATKTGTSYSGVWSISDEDSSDDSPEDLHFNIFFNLTNDFEDLNDDWEIVSHSGTKIELIDVSGGNGDTDYLTFEKN